MKKIIFSFLIVIVVLFGINFVSAKDEPNGQPFKDIWEAIDELRTDLTTENLWDRNGVGLDRSEVVLEPHNANDSIDLSSGDLTTTGNISTVGFNFSDDINLRGDSFFYNWDADGLFITAQAGSPTGSSFYTAKRLTGSSGSAGIAFGETGSADLWDILIGAGSNDLRFMNISGMQTKSAALEQATGHFGLGTYNPAARIHAIDTAEQLRLAYDASNYASFATGSDGSLAVTTTGLSITTDGGVKIVLPGSGSRTRPTDDTGKLLVEGYSSDTATEPFVEFNALNNDGNRRLFQIGTLGKSVFDVDNDGDVVCGRSIAANTFGLIGFIADAVAYSNANNGMKFGTYQPDNIMKGRATFGQDGVIWGQKTPNRNLDFDYVTIARDIDGSSAWTYSGYLLKMTDDVTNYKGGTWGYINADDGFLLENDFSVLVTNKIKFTQTDGNEYIDSLNDGYLDLGATRDVRINNNLDVTGIEKYENASTATLLANNSSVVVRFPTAFAGGVTPVVVATPPYQTSFWITNISNTGFTFNVGTTSGYDQTIMYIAMEES